MSGILLHLMRHGAPREPGLLLGHRDVPALPTATADCVQRAVGLDFEQVLSSDLSRAHEPARQIAGLRKLAHRADRRWRELDFGEWDGLAPHELDPTARTRFWDDPDGCPPPGGERWSQLRDRVSDVIQGLDRSSLAVTHGGTIRAVLSALFGFDHRQVWAFELGYGALLSLRLWPQEGGHLPAAQIVALDRGRA